MRIPPENLTGYFHFAEAPFLLHRQIIPPPAAKAAPFGLVLEGTILLESIDENGVRRITDFYTAGDFFLPPAEGEADKNGLALTARTKCRIAFLYPKKEREETAARKTEQAIYLETYRRLLEHVHILQQPSLRLKLQTFLEYHRQRSGCNPFTLVISFTDCADYMAVDRSAMMRELGWMQRDGLLRHTGRNIFLQPSM